MIPSNLAYDYVKDIPWEQNPAFAFSDDAEAYISAFQSVVKKLPEEKDRISFSAVVNVKARVPLYLTPSGSE